MRAVSALALGHIHTQPDTIIPLLIACLDDPSDGVPPAAARGLGEFGPSAKAAVPKLVPLAKSHDKDLRMAAMAALRQIDPLALQPPAAK